MTERSRTIENTPVRTLAYLMREANISRLYIEQQDVYPVESQRAALVLPVVEEAIEDLTGQLSDIDISMARKWAELLLKGSTSKAEDSEKGEF